MDDALAAALVRVRHAGHSVTVLSLADEPFEQDLGKVTVYDLTRALQSLEARASKPSATVERVWREMEEFEPETASGGNRP
jgi:hypothetical protein